MRVDRGSRNRGFTQATNSSDPRIDGTFLLDSSAATSPDPPWAMNARGPGPNPLSDGNGRLHGVRPGSSPGYKRPDSDCVMAVTATGSTTISKVSQAKTPNPIGPPRSEGDITPFLRYVPSQRSWLSSAHVPAGFSTVAIPLQMGSVGRRSRASEHGPGDIELSSY